MKSFKQYFEERIYWGTEAAGTVFIANDTKRILFLKRSGEEDSEQDHWEITIGGKKDPEDIDAGATRDREAREELGIDVPILDIISLEVFIDTGEDHRPFKYFSFAKIVQSEFTPILSEEHSNFKWVNIKTEEDKIPTPLHFGAQHLIYDTNRLKKIMDKNYQ